MPEYSLRSELTPQILSVLLVSPDRMSMFNLFRYIQHLTENHQDTQRYQIALWRKILYPFAVFVMLVLSLPFAYLHTRAGVVGVKVFGGIMIGMSFQLFNTLFSHIGTLNTWPAPIDRGGAGAGVSGRSGWSGCGGWTGISRLGAEEDMSKHGMVLFGHGARDPRWAEPFERLAAKLRAHARRAGLAGFS